MCYREINQAIPCTNPLLDAPSFQQNLAPTTGNRLNLSLITKPNIIKLLIFFLLSQQLQVFCEIKRRRVPPRPVCRSYPESHPCLRNPALDLPESKTNPTCNIGWKFKNCFLLCLITTRIMLVVVLQLTPRS